MEINTLKHELKYGKEKGFIHNKEIEIYILRN